MTDPGLGGSQHEFVDLHTHSTASDGSRTPRDVVVVARAAGLAAIALTDHDTIDGLNEAQSAADELGMRVIYGIELSAVENSIETHVLGLHLTKLSELDRQLRELREMRLSRAARIVERLSTLGVKLSIDAVLREAAGGALGRPHIARALVAAGAVGDVREAFDRYIGNGKPAFIPKDDLAFTDAISLIHRAGGLAFLAHPGGLGTLERIAPLVTMGLDGVEVLHPSHSWDDSQRLDAIAGQLKLLRSGGSDWHGSSDGSRTLGMMRVPGQWLIDQEARIASRASRHVA